MSGEVRIGDVGYLRDGHFCFLFNTMLGADDPVNLQQGVPDDFVVFNVPQPPLHWENEITDTQLHSKTVRSMEVAATMPMTETVASASVGLRYQCNADSGALLLLKQPAHKTVLDCPLHIKKYMMTHLASWHDFANRLGIGLDEKDIVFISGFLKATVWATAAFSNNSDSAELVIAGGCFVPAASGAFRVSVSRGVEASVASRAGPQGRVSTWTDGADQGFKYDQCIFLSYYKMKCRGMLRRPRVMRAAAGPHTLPGKHDDDDYSSPDIPSSLSTSSASQESKYVERSYDPVNELLDYILKV
ncbi:hypothetical protein GSI_02140 [Ganoderma sinense ZZ0214-1]|uniref:Uncharacterized protein n=1 Tax=Ganoderma sinense ZZ0214-1 TaxID=1077348 RepID=A0A2G8SNR8_9APHY|nr:hypothetical protein GSI_02140 [Ganoderma sinense ZZ0214-1]